MPWDSVTLRLHAPCSTGWATGKQIHKKCGYIMMGREDRKGGERQQEGEVKQRKGSDWLVIHLSDRVQLPQQLTAARTSCYTWFSSINSPLLHSSCTPSVSHVLSLSVCVKSLWCQRRRGFRLSHVFWNLLFFVHCLSFVLFSAFRFMLYEIKIITNKITLIFQYSKEKTIENFY